MAKNFQPFGESFWTGLTKLRCTCLDEYFEENIFPVKVHSFYQSRTLGRKVLASAEKLCNG